MDIETKCELFLKKIEKKFTAFPRQQSMFLIS